METQAINCLLVHYDESGGCLNKPKAWQRRCLGTSCTDAQHIPSELNIFQQVRLEDCEAPTLRRSEKLKRRRGVGPAAYTHRRLYLRGQDLILPFLFLFLWLVPALFFFCSVLLPWCSPSVPFLLSPRFLSPYNLYTLTKSFK